MKTLPSPLFKWPKPCRAAAGAINLPFDAADTGSHQPYVQQIARVVSSNEHRPDGTGQGKLVLGEGNGSGKGSSETAPLYVVCRRGNDSQRVVRLLHEGGIRSAVDLIGGLEAWAADSDGSFPVY